MDISELIVKVHVYTKFVRKNEGGRADEDLRQSLGTRCQGELVRAQLEEDWES